MHTAPTPSGALHAKGPSPGETAPSRTCRRAPHVFPLDGLPSELVGVLLSIFLDGAQGHSGYPYAAFKLRLVSHQWNGLVSEFMRTRRPSPSWQWFARQGQNRFAGQGSTALETPALDCALLSLRRFNSGDLSMLLKAQLPAALAEAGPQSHVQLGARSINDLLALVPPGKTAWGSQRVRAPA